MTLTELLIACALVGIVTLGLIAAEQAIRTSRQSSSRDNQLSAQLQATMLRLTRSASLTSGDAVDTGIVEYITQDRTVCFREAAGDPNTYADDKWNCWWYNSLNQDLTSCEGLDNPSPSACPGPATQKTWIKITNPNPNFYTLVSIPPATPIPPAKLDYIQIDLISLFDPLSTKHDISNPEYRLTSNVNPPGLSR